MATSRSEPLSPAAKARRILEYVPISSIRPNESNARLHGRAQIASIAKSINAFGFNAPILVDARGQIVAGHGRYEAAKQLGLGEVPVVHLEHLSEHQIQAYMLADNRLAEKSTWDGGRVANVLKDLAEIALDFDLEATGFEAAEIDLRIQSLQPAEASDADDEDLPGAPAQSVTRQGDLWELGSHRLLCADARDPAAFERLVGPEKAAAMITDPPYGVRIRGHVSGKGRRKHREFPMASGEMTSAEFSAFLHQFLSASAAALAEDAVSFICMDWRHLEELSGAIRQAGQSLLNLCVWVKTNGGMGALYRSQHELVFVTARAGAKPRNNVQLGKFGRYRTNVWNYPGMNSFARRGQIKGVDLHPTVKPVAMIADAIRDVTARNDAVLDPFCGSGTIFVAAHRTGRRAFGIELDPGYVDVAIERWQRATGENAVHESGKTLAQLAAERGSDAGS